MKTFTRIAAATAALGLIAAPASQAFAASATENALIGAAIGALGGALVSHGTKGVVVGAAAGAAVGLATDKKDGRRFYESANRPVYRSSTPVYRSSQPVYYDRYGRPVYASNQYGYAQPTRYGYGY